LNNLAWGAGTGAITGGLDAALYEENIWQGMYRGAAFGVAFSVGMSTLECLKNLREVGYFGTDIETFDYLAERAVSTTIVNGLTTTTVDPKLAQESLDYWTLSFGGPKMYVTSNGGSPVTNNMTGRIDIPIDVFKFGPDVLRVAMAHEAGHYINDIIWDNGKIGGKISNPGWKDMSAYYGNDGVQGYHYAIKNAGRYHIKLWLNFRCW